MGDGWRRRCYNIDRLRAEAKRVLPKAVFDFTDGGAEDEVTLRRNESDFRRWSFLPRPLEGAGVPDLSVELLGRILAMPVMIGPTGLSGLMWPGGEACAARAAAAAGIGFCLSHGSVCRLEDIPASGTPRWMQVFIFRDRGFTGELADRAAASGYDALVLTIDNQVLGNRERDIRNGFAIPPRFKAADVAAMALKLPWLMRMRRELPRITFGNYVRGGERADIGSLARRMAELLDPAMSWRDVAWLRQRWKGPLVLKGVQHPDEARKAVDHGVDAVIVSNHGGRQLDGAASAVAALPAVVGAVEGRMPVLVDGGIRRGADIVKALALGASCCLIARPQLWGLAVAGEAGVAHALDILRRDMARVMALLGTARAQQITRDLVVPAW
jgi:isopentenyl diphosphate isomerase/L-lactate dehydrogenase-like FMN-dependent dehydrogenase